MESSDEDLERFREAVDPEFANKSSSYSNKKVAKTKPLTPSLRPKLNDDQFNTLGATPQFQDFVAKKLSSILEKRIKMSLTETSSNTIKKKNKNKIRLFKNSQKYVKINEKIVNKRAVVQSDDSDDNSKYSAVAVDPTDVINQTEVKGWSTKTKGKVFNYKNVKGTNTLIDT